MPKEKSMVLYAIEHKYHKLVFCQECINLQNKYQKELARRVFVLCREDMMDLAPPKEWYFEIALTFVLGTKEMKKEALEGRSEEYIKGWQDGAMDLAYHLDGNI